jgi:PKD repeat protein
MNKRILFAIFIIISLSGCYKTPTACYHSSSTQNVRVNAEIEFDAGCSVQASSYSWNFGDGSTATVIRPKHTFTKEGEFSVTLKIKNGPKSDEITSIYFVQK